MEGESPRAAKPDRGKAVTPLDLPERAPPRPWPQWPRDGSPPPRPQGKPRPPPAEKMLAKLLARYESRSGSPKRSEGRALVPAAAPRKRPPPLPPAPAGQSRLVCPTAIAISAPQPTPEAGFFYISEQPRGRRSAPPEWASETHVLRAGDDGHWHVVPKAGGAASPSSPPAVPSGLRSAAPRAALWPPTASKWERAGPDGWEPAPGVTCKELGVAGHPPRALSPVLRSVLSLSSPPASRIAREDGWVSDGTSMHHGLSFLPRYSSLCDRHVALWHRQTRNRAGRQLERVRAAIRTAGRLSPLAPRSPRGPGSAAGSAGSSPRARQQRRRRAVTHAELLEKVRAEFAALLIDQGVLSPPRERPPRGSVAQEPPPWRPVLPCSTALDPGGVGQLHQRLVSLRLRCTGLDVEASEGVIGSWAEQGDPAVSWPRLAVVLANPGREVGPELLGELRADWQAEFGSEHSRVGRKRFERWLRSLPLVDPAASPPAARLFSSACSLRCGAVGASATVDFPSAASVLWQYVQQGGDGCGPALISDSCS
eukprot:TRINITY_DN49992_c0_g1_i1.p1 TRINITY_DN49992_c0_g1~~TRINITY_DN49992_c0_g1_i1.p1  ORF type:complete len:565 (+),score=89.39 TRINITY_DN49992_c0_g1_i1:80-1696(+)